MARKSSENRSNGTGATSPGPRPGPGSATGPGSEPGSGLGNQRGTEPGPTPGPCGSDRPPRARRMVRDACRAPDRLIRAGVTLARLRESAPPRRILFVTTGTSSAAPLPSTSPGRGSLPARQDPVRVRRVHRTGRPPPPEAVDGAPGTSTSVAPVPAPVGRGLAYADLVLVVEPRQGVQYLGCRLADRCPGRRTSR